MNDMDRAQAHYDNVNMLGPDGGQEPVKKGAEEWCEEYYPVYARDIAAHTDDALRLTNHSLKKWEGATKEVLEEYGLGCPPITFRASTCSLCAKYLVTTRLQGIMAPVRQDCAKCPLAQSRDGYACGQITPEEDASGERSPWMAWMDGNNPLPMIEALTKARAMLLEQAGGE